MLGFKRRESGSPGGQREEGEGLPLPGSAEGLVCGGGHHVRVVEGRGDAAGRHQAADVGHVGQQVGLHLRAQLGDTQCEVENQLVKPSDSHTFTCRHIG